MTVTFALAWLIAGLVVGIVATRFYCMRQFNQNKLQLELNETKQQLQQYRADVTEHIDTTHQLMNQLHEHYDKIARHMAQTKKQLIERPGFEPRSDVNYFAGDTAAQIRQSIHKLDERRKVNDQASHQPLDYSADASGLMRSHTERTASDN